MGACVLASHITCILADSESGATCSTCMCGLLLPFHCEHLMKAANEHKGRLQLRLRCWPGNRTLCLLCRCLEKAADEHDDDFSKRCLQLVKLYQVGPPHRVRLAPP